MIFGVANDGEVDDEFEVSVTGSRSDFLSRLRLFARKRGGSYAFVESRQSGTIELGSTRRFKIWGLLPGAQKRLPIVLNFSFGTSSVDSHVLVQQRSETSAFSRQAKSLDSRFRREFEQIEKDIRSIA